ncbi:MAG: transglutaminase family protein [Acidimicrobiales bacterium]
MPTRLVMRQTLRYDYPAPVHSLDHHLMVLPPPHHGDQVRTHASVEVQGVAAEVTERLDPFGNIALRVRAARVPAWVEFVVDVAVERHEPSPATLPAGDGRRLVTASELTRPDAALRRAARGLLASGDAGLGLARRINAWVASAMTYRHDVTGVRTTAARALAHGAGVCQDYAHVMLALSRLCGLPARYVSGHMIGEGGSHAWVEVLFPSAADPARLAPVAFDPTNNRLAGSTYMTVATGRDYADVAPTHGSYCGPAGGRLSTAKSLEQETVHLVAC